jgi:hypothetical protein
MDKKVVLFNIFQFDSNDQRISITKNESEFEIEYIRSYGLFINNINVNSTYIIKIEADDLNRVEYEYNFFDKILIPVLSQNEPHYENVILTKFNSNKIFVFNYFDGSEIVNFYIIEIR